MLFRKRAYLSPNTFSLQERPLRKLPRQHKVW